MIKKIIKMNDNTKYLSLGNLFNIIKDNAKNKTSAQQSEIFYALFNVKEINNTTVNNYCIGYRTIGIEYKKIYYDLKERFLEDNTCYYDICLNILNILDEHIYSKDNALETINSSESLKNVIKGLQRLSLEDSEVSKDLKVKVDEYVNNNDLYNAFILLINYAILENRQPRYLNSHIINEEELNEYIKLNLSEGITHITGLKELANKGNMYACCELGSLEFSGFVSGKKDLKKCYDYYMKAASKGHPKGYWMVANLILTGRVGSLDKDFDLAWEYLNKAIELKSIAALNTMGNCYLNGLNPNKEINEEKALEYYKLSAEDNYMFAYNNLGLYYERQNDIKEALKYYRLSASLGESWALNKLGEYYRKNNDMKTAFFYYKKASETPISERSAYSLYNLAKYYYLEGEETTKIKKNTKKAKEYFEKAYDNGVKEALEELIKLNEE